MAASRLPVVEWSAAKSSGVPTKRISESCRSYSFSGVILNCLDDDQVTRWFVGTTLDSLIAAEQYGGKSIGDKNKRKHIKRVQHRLPGPKFTIVRHMVHFLFLAAE